MKLKVTLKDDEGNTEFEIFAKQRDLAMAEKWAKAFQMLFVDGLLSNDDLEITVERRKGRLNLYV